jgi:hypothetical protein
MPAPTLTAPPPIPLRNDATTFNARFATFLLYLATFVTEETAVVDFVNDQTAAIAALAASVAASETDLEAAAAASIAASDFMAVSTSTLIVGSGTKTIRFTAPVIGFAVNDLVVIIQRSDPSIRMLGTVATFDGADDMTVTVVSSGVFGSGEYSSWLIVSAAFLVAGAPAADILAAATDAAAITPKGIKDAKAFVALTDGATVTPSGASGRNFTWTTGGNRTLGAITNCSPGDVFFLEITQDGAGNRILAWASGVYFRSGGLPILSTAAGAKDDLQIKIVTVDGSGTATRAIATFARAPTN